ncbi:methyltransferase domain-containing protein [Pseudonocardia xinjiangensis]|uniref:methyltransferase domain-containing protein n=1 Tax=Pseudonocardia xinjiangensis TaxID=75289 RepID=UPI003D9266B7
MVAADRARARMVDALRDAGRIRSPAVEDAFRAVPRHLFLPGLSIDDAYADEAVAVQFAEGVATSSASQPSMMAIMLEQLDLRPGHRVLEIGAGTGYNAALMARIVGPTGAVTAVDIDEDLIAGAAVHLADAGVTGVGLVVGDGALGHPPLAPYDRIVLTVGSSDIRPEWVAQLAPGGRLLLPLAVRGSQLSTALDLGPDGVLRSDSVRSCAFIRLRGLGASTDVAARLDGFRLMLQVAEDGPGPDAAEVAAALACPGGLLPVPVRLGSADVWDGFGLWLALTELGTCRLLASDAETGLPDDLLPLGPGRGTIALATVRGEQPSGLAMVVAGPDRSDGSRASSVGVRVYGAAGPVLGVRLLTALERWLTAGRPGAAEWQMAAVPAGALREPLPPGVAVVRKEHCCLLLDMPGLPTK